MPEATASIIPLSAATQRVLATLDAAGFECWVVGGYVRDALRGMPCADVDITTEAVWTDVERLFCDAGARVVETGTKHGTVTVILDHEPFEITTYRVDGPYGDGRHPDYVSRATSIDEDLARRDFTVNAMAYRPDEGLRDPFGGARDLERGLITTVGEPDKRFSEDALRLLRACRFCSQLDFSLDEPTASAMRRCKHLLAGVSVERIAHELTRLLTGQAACRALLETREVIAVALPEIAACFDFDQKSPYHCFDVYEHIARTVGATRPEALVRWAALCHDLGKPATFFTDDTGTGHFYGHGRVSAAITRGIMRRLHMPTAFAEQVEALVAHHDDEVPPTRRAITRLLANLGGKEQTLRALFELKRADSRAHAPEHRGGVKIADELERAFDDLKRQNAAFSVKDLAISGHDAMACGIPQGPAVGEALQAAFDLVSSEKLPNKHDTLCEFLQNWKNLKRGVDESDPSL